MLILSLPGHALKNITKACVEDIKSPNGPHTKLWFLLFGLVLVNQLSLDILHQPIKNLHIAVDGDVHLFPTLGLHREVLSKVMHLPDQQFTGTREVLFHWNAHKDEAKFATGFFQTLLTVIFSLQLTSSQGHVKSCFTEMHTRMKQSLPLAFSKHYSQLYSAYSWQVHGDTWSTVSLKCTQEGSKTFVTGFF